MARVYSQINNMIQKSCCKSCHVAYQNKTRVWSEVSKLKISKANSGRLGGDKNPNYSNAITYHSCHFCNKSFTVTNYDLRGNKRSGKFCSLDCYGSYKKANRMSDEQKRLYKIFSRNIASCLRKGKKRTKWTEMVGYSLQELKAHLESQFKVGMSWENYGRYGWHIDHIKPISFFNFSSPNDKEFLECWGLKNLQPLWAIENLQKGGSNRIANILKYGKK